MMQFAYIDNIRTCSRMHAFLQLALKNMAIGKKNMGLSHMTRTRWLNQLHQLRSNKKSIDVSCRKAHDRERFVGRV
jgi:hypothetical protein